MNDIESIEVLTAGQVAKALRVERDTVYKWCKRGVIPHYKLEGSVRLHLGDVLEFLENRRVEGSKKVKATC